MFELKHQLTQKFHKFDQNLTRTGKIFHQNPLNLIEIVQNLIKFDQNLIKIPKIPPKYHYNLNNSTKISKILNKVSQLTHL